MTIGEALSAIDGLKYNTYTREEKLLWLGEVEGRILRELLDTHEDAPEPPPLPFNRDTPLTTELLVPWPYDKLYITFLEMKMDYFSGEIERYNNSARSFNALYGAYSRFYNRNHLPKGQHFRFP